MTANNSERLTNEQIEQILEGAEIEDNHFLELDGNHTRYTRLVSDHHCLSDLEEILSLRVKNEELSVENSNLRQEVERLREELAIQTKRGDIASGAIDTALALKEKDRE